MALSVGVKHRIFVIYWLWNAYENYFETLSLVSESLVFYRGSPRSTSVSIVLVPNKPSISAKGWRRMKLDITTRRRSFNFCYECENDPIVDTDFTDPWINSSGPRSREASGCHAKEESRTSISISESFLLWCTSGHERRCNPWTWPVTTWGPMKSSISAGVWKTIR